MKDKETKRFMLEKAEIEALINARKGQKNTRAK